MKLWTLGLMAIAFVANSARAQSDDVVQLRKEVSELRAQVKALADELGRVTKILASAGSKIEVRPGNPFGLADVPDPDGPDVQAFAAHVKFLGGNGDENAEQWTDEAIVGDRKSIDGEWQGRWNFTGRPWVPSFRVQIRSVGDRVYVLYTDHQGRFLGDFKRERDGRLVGRLRGVDNPADTNPTVLLFVDAERIDGAWGGRGRIDFRRKLK